ncbi:MAG TPA: hypothetical protein PLS84_07145, partial [Salinivirgaceae bacterium]|nr:hypothetical protein [Salinivirgaceae bacterium]
MSQLHTTKLMNLSNNYSKHNPKNLPINIGLDAGSTTIKIVVTNSQNQIIYKDYRRHYADVLGNLKEILSDILDKIGDCPIKLCITGSAGMGVAERYNVPFAQEVVASCEVIMRQFPDIKTFVDIGGEDSKMIFFKPGKTP